MKYLFKLTFVLLLAAGVSTCSDYLKPKTPQNKPIESVEDVDDLRALMNGAYSRLSQTQLYGRNVIILGDVRTGNAFSIASTNRFDNQSLLQVTPGQSLPIWDAAYEVIANCNIIINSDVEGEGVQQVKGEAYALRALTHMILLKMYSELYVDGSDLGIPYVTTYGVRENFFPQRPSVQESLAQIGADYETALSLLDPTITGSVTQLTYYGALAIQSRYYLYTENYAAASAAAKEVIDSGPYSLVAASEYVAAWANDGQPAMIFEIDMNTTDALASNSIFQIVAGEAYGDVEVTEELFNLFGPSDVRNGLYATEVTETDKTTPVIDYRVTGKYPDQYINVPVIRYAEIILTYAEAQARLGNAAEALTYLNMIPANRNANLYTVASIENILLERRKELAMEGLYYWQRLRTGQGIDRTNMRIEHAEWEVAVPYGNHRLAFPIPTAEINGNPNIQQNAGY